MLEAILSGLVFMGGSGGEVKALHNPFPVIGLAQQVNRLPHPVNANDKAGPCGLTPPTPSS